jgi:hypothetical protein
MNALHILALVITVPVSTVFFIGGAALAVIDWDR